MISLIELKSIHLKHSLKGLFVSPGPFPRPRPWPPFCVCRPWPPIFIYWPRPPICIYRPCLAICIYRHWPTILLPARGLSLHIPTFSPEYVFVFTAMVYDMYYWSGAWICIYLIIGSSSSGRSNSSSYKHFQLYS